MAKWQENQLPTPTEQPEHWVMYFDGSLKLEGAGAGVLLISPTGKQLKYVLQIFWKVENKFYGLEFHHVVRNNNVAADVLSKRGSTRAQVPAGVFVHELHAPSIPEPVPMTTDPAPFLAGQEVMMIDVD
jgi:hypothetical protein